MGPLELGTSYRSIWKVSIPIIIGSAAQNVVAMTDSVFLYYRSEDDFAAIGFVAASTSSSPPWALASVGADRS